MSLFLPSKLYRRFGVGLMYCVGRQNFSMMSEYMTSMGRIRHRKDTGLRAVNQRKIAKAIRRAVGMGLMPSVHKHPEILEAEKKVRIEREYYRNQSGRGRLR